MNQRAESRIIQQPNQSTAVDCRSLSVLCKSVAVINRLNYRLFLTKPPLVIGSYQTSISRQAVQCFYSAAIFKRRNLQRRLHPLLHTKLDIRFSFVVGKTTRRTISHIGTFLIIEKPELFFDPSIVVPLSIFIDAAKTVALVSSGVFFLAFGDRGKEKKGLLLFVVFERCKNRTNCKCWSSTTTFAYRVPEKTYEFTWPWRSRMETAAST
jgi:hypothetical protein